MVHAQGGNLDVPRPRATELVLTASQAGYVSAIDTEALGYAIIELGGGRKVKEDVVDPTVGLEMLVRLGESIEPGQPLLKLFAHDRGRGKARELALGAFEFSESLCKAPPLVQNRLD